MVMFFTGNGRYDFDIVGESHYQDNLDLVAGPKGFDGCNFECVVALTYDDTNVHDPLAVAVIVWRENDAHRRVGFLSRKDARIFRREVADLGHDPSQFLLCRAKIVGGWRYEELGEDEDGQDDSHSEGMYGVKLDLVMPLQGFITEDGDTAKRLR